MSRKRPEKRRARGLRFTLQKQQEVLGYLRAGLHRKTTAKLCRLGERTLARWVEKGRKSLEAVDDALDRGEEIEPDEYGLFVLELDFVEAHARAQVYADMMRAGKNDWRCQAHVLERLEPDVWGSAAHGMRDGVETESGERESAADILLERIGLIEKRALRAKTGVRVEDEDV